MSSTVFARKMRIAKAEREKELDEEQLHRAEKELVSSMVLEKGPQTSLIYQQDGLIFAAYSAQEEQNYQEAVGFYTRALTVSVFLRSSRFSFSFWSTLSSSSFFLIFIFFCVCVSNAGHLLPSLSPSFFSFDQRH